MRHLIANAVELSNRFLVFRAANQQDMLEQRSIPLFCIAGIEFLFLRLALEREVVLSKKINIKICWFGKYSTHTFRFTCKAH